MADNSGLIVDALHKTDPTLHDSIDGANSWKQDVIKRGARVKKYRAYERGDHDADMTEQMIKMLRIKDGEADLNELPDNYCGIVVDKMAGRIQVSEISVAPESDDASKWLSDLLERNNYAQLEGETNRGAVRDGDAYQLISSVDLSWNSEPAYDGFSGIVAIFGKGAPVWACKLWSESDISDDDESQNVVIKVIVYQPDEISFFEGTDGGAEVKSIDVPEDAKASGLVVNDNSVTWPVGAIPLVQRANRRDNYTSSGKSELRVAIPIQNVLNRTFYSMVMASELSAFKVYWSKGLEIDKDGITPGAVINLLMKGKDGKVSTELSEAAARFLAACEIGEMKESNMENYTVQIETIVREMSQVTQTPIYGVTMTGNLSGEALKQLEIGLIGKVKRFQRENTNSVQRLIELTAKIQDTFNIDGMGKPPKFDTVSVTWKSPEIIDVPAQLESYGKLFKDFGTQLFSMDWYRKQVGGQLGISQADIAELSEDADEQQSVAMERLLSRRTVPPA